MNASICFGVESQTFSIQVNHSNVDTSTLRRFEVLILFRNTREQLPVYANILFSMKSP